MPFLPEGNMKKQLYRVKQLADQKFAGAERTEMLDDDLVFKDKQVETLRQVCQNTHRQAKNCLQGQGTDGASLDKRLKKLPEFCLGSTMLECNSFLGENSILGQVLGLSGKLQCDLAQELLTFEVEVERLVLAKYVEILESDIPSIAKQRKQLKKLTLDYDSAKARYQQAVRQSVQTPSNTIDNIKFEYDEAKQKVEACKDAFSTEIYACLAKETDLARCLYQLTESQMKYHRRALEVLENSIPNINNAILISHDKPVYGVPLEEHLHAANSDIALPIEKCVCCLLEYGIEEEGILRIAGSSSKVKKLKNSFDVGLVDMHDYDPPAVAGAMKQYLRELPEPLMTFELYDDWMEIAKFSDKEFKLEAIKKILPKMPKSNYDNLRYLIKFLAKVASFQDVNKMSSQNLAIVIAINLIWSIDEEQLGMNMSLATMRSAIVDLLISHADELFPGEEDFGVPQSSKIPLEEYTSLSPPLAVADDDDDFEVMDVNQSYPFSDNYENRRPSFSKPYSSNGNTKEGSPKVVRRENKFKKKAPPVPPPPKDGHDKSTGDKTKSHVHNEDNKPCLPAHNPRHVRTSSGASIDLSRPSSSTSASDAEGSCNPFAVKEQSITRVVDETPLLDPMLRSNLRASLPGSIKINEDVESKTSSFRSVAHVAAFTSERSKSHCELLSNTLEAMQFENQQDENAEEFPTVANSEKGEIDVAIANGMKAKRTNSFGNTAPERPPRPQLLTHESQPHNKELKSTDPMASKLKTEFISAEDSVFVNDGDKEIKKVAVRNPYVNLPPTLEALKCQQSVTVENVEPKTVCDDVEDINEDSSPPERPTKNDKSKMVPPQRPEKSERLRALIDTKNQATKPCDSEEIVKSAHSKEKPTRPPPCSIALVDKEKPASLPLKPARIYPALTEMEVAYCDESEQNSKLIVGIDLTATNTTNSRQLLS
ncbi:Rho GTPase-activating protein 44, variant 2 [Chamberlinius hualienensis]